MGKLNDEDGFAILHALEIMREKVEQALQEDEQSHLEDPLIPPAAGPASTALQDATDNFQELPFSQEEVDATIQEVLNAAEFESRKAQMTEQGIAILKGITGLVPKLYGLPGI